MNEKSSSLIPPPSSLALREFIVHRSSFRSQPVTHGIEAGQTDRQLAAKRNLAGDRFDRRQLGTRIRVVREDVRRQLRNVLQHIRAAEQRENEGLFLRRQIA